ncbi:polyprenol phosphomannose-dependent alpha 1,6 mannosyltransferase MptB [Mesonia aestuariivivens]|uniref:Polyprenol phosphomannose-dependent alpha 1,6 mannosyltransferase MptB n=1 Tax=Mesonia aestuariivivens TaxID=2796128 RepID=A0ABS6VZH0_9FLAO|nr:polyprenol phosphomannose-dependent alpha 1,6 mannosyltransferase MptB [Mesonia aestuariivivens]MBW2960990.1 polyprenol phosphomannose-dependent alpha 1,6 mannosyltransferase MptB [Mesonia aestuariivivens]
MMLALCAFYFSFAYNLVRTDFVKLSSLYLALFFLSFKLIQQQKTNWKLLLGFGIACRLLFLFALPNLSQDFYRFIWDGRLIVEGINPYLSTPQQWLASGKIAAIVQGEELVKGMQALNASHFTNYPPVSQFVYALAGIVTPKNILGSVMVMRIVLIFTDVITFIFFRKLLQYLKLPLHQAFWYFLNPLVIIELTGNLHFEGLMVMFLVIAFYLLLKKKLIWAAILFGLSVSVKLLPLVLLPLFFNYFRKQEQLNIYKLITFYGVNFLSVLLTFLPFLSVNLIQNFGDSVALWFNTFEFNASLYYIIRWVGFQTMGWNIISIAGKILSVIILLSVLSLAFFRKNNSCQRLFVSMLFALSIYFLCATTIHPWYVITPLAISILTRYRFILIWSVSVMLSYSAYRTNGFEEKLYLVALEYILVISVVAYEFKSTKKLFCG